MTVSGPTGVAGDPPVTLRDLVRAQVRQRPGEVAVAHHDGRTLTYQQLWEEAGHLAAALAASGIGHPDTVAIAADRSVEMVIAMLAVLRLGARYVLLDPYSPAARNQLMVEEVQARALIEASPAASSQPDWSITDVAHRFTVPLASGASQGKAPDEHHHSPDDIRYIAYTSGSTGRPKGTLTSDRAVVNFVTESALCRVCPGDRMASLTNPASDATTLEIWKPLAMGATVVILPHVGEMDVADWPKVLGTQRITVMFMMAGLVELIAREDPAAFASLDTLIFGGEALNPQTALRICAAAPPRRLVLGYGPTECTVFSTYFDCVPDSVSGRDRIPLGFPLRGYHLSIVDDSLHDVPDGDAGELCVGGPSVGNGYLARPEMTAQRFIQLPGREGVAYRTGDIVRRLPGGALEFVGRIDRQVKIRGFRVELEEVERVILATGRVRSAVVEKVDGEPPHLVCFFIPAVTGPRAESAFLPQEAVLGSDLTATLAPQLPGYMIPARWFAVRELPFTTIGKVDRARLLGTISPRGGQ